MGTPENSESVTTSLQLEPILGIESVTKFYEELKALLDANQPIALDGSAVENIDTASLQLLTVFCLELQARDIPFNWHEPSETLRHSAVITGLVDTLMLPEAA